MQPVARVSTCYPDKFGAPRQSGLVPDARARLVFEPPFRHPDAVRGLEGFSHLWLVWVFSENVDKGWSPTVRPPRLGGNVRMGVFATRSPFRPNAIGLSCVRLDHIEQQTPEGPVIWVRGADLLDGSPIFDIKPYLPYADAHPEALGGFALQEKEGALRIVFPEELLARVPEELRQGLCDVLRQDPRPGYQDEPGRRYGMAFAGFDVRFTVENGVLTVVEVAEK